MNAFEFMSESPVLSFFLAWILAIAVKWCVCLPFRAMNIRKHGWPPAHLDADGDYKRKDKSE